MTLFFDMLSVFLRPKNAFRNLAKKKPSLTQVFLGYALWLGLLPPVSAYIGTSQYGWRLGIGEPVLLNADESLIIAVTYYFSLLFGFAAATFLTKWMAPTYGGNTHAGGCAALTALVGTPLMFGGLLHLYPLLPLNLLCLLPAIIWSIYLLYTGLPVLLGIDTERGMLMASVLLGVFFVAAVSLAGFTMMLWTLGLGPNLGFDWQSSVG